MVYVTNMRVSEDGSSRKKFEMTKQVKKGDTKITIDRNCEFKIDCKRLHLPVEIHSKCPFCGEPVYLDLSDSDYLAYPDINGIETVGGLCPNDHEFFIKLKFTINVEEVR